MNTVEFLRAILPSQGVYFFATPLPSGGYKHTAVQSPEALAELAAASSRRGVNTFFACSSFDKPEYVGADGKRHWRTGENAVAAKAQWLDIDCGEQYQGSQKNGLLALIQFCTATGLPRPNLTVNSGNGIHVYWLFDRDVPKDQWVKAASVFKAVCKHFGFAQDDTSRTADIASVLRPIGTVNDKSHNGLGVKPVKLIGAPVSEPISFSSWVRELLRLQSTLGLRVPTSTKKAPNINSELGGDTEYPPSNADTVALHCSQIRRFKEFRGAGQTEPLWHACIGVVKHCTDGERFAQEWSSGHEAYDYATCQAKINLWKYAPTTCERFKAVDAAGCAGCLHTVSSPILLGRDTPAAPLTTELERSEESIPLPEFPSSLAARYKPTQLGLQAKTTDENGVVTWQVICKTIPYVTDYYFDVNDEQWKVRLDVYVKPKVWNTAELAVSFIGKGGALLMGELAARTMITASKGNHKYMEDYLRTWVEEMQQLSDETDMHSHMGWYEDGSFLLGDMKYLPDGSTQRIMLRSEIRRLADTFSAKGDRARYIELIDRAYNRPMHQPYQFTWLAGFASPLLYLIHPEPVGIVLDGWSVDSGFGKSTVAKLATGIWGRPDITDANGTTEFALTVNAGMKRNLPLVIDESTEWSGEKSAGFAYRYSSGRAKDRGKADGSLVDNSHINWCNMLFTNGNKPLSEGMMAAYANCAPQLARVFEYKFDVPHDQTLSETEGPKLFTELFKIHGAGGLGVEFIKYIVPRQKGVEKLLHDTYGEIMNEAGLKKDARYWVYAAACVWVAYRVTRSLKMHTFDGRALRAWLIQSLKSMKLLAVEAVKDMGLLFGDMMSDLHSGFIVTTNAGDRRANILAAYAPGYSTPRGKITGRVIVSSREVYVNTSAIYEWCNDHGVNPREMQETIKARGWLIKRDKFRLGAGTLIAVPATHALKLDWGAFAGVMRAVSTNADQPEHLAEGGAV